MPPVSPIAVSCLSVRFRECGLKTCAFECVATRGALLIAATSQNPRSLRCDRSIKIPNRLQAPISSLPRSVRPGPVSGEEGQRSYMSSCLRETITGGTVTVGTDRSDVRFGSVERVNAKCDPGEITLTGGTAIGGSVFRGLAK